MFRLPVSSKLVHHRAWCRSKSSSSVIRASFMEYFVEGHGHKHVKSSSVVPLCDPTVPFVNAGMNQFKGVFLGTVAPPHLRVVNSQKCVRAGGKHNDLAAVGTDGHHHTFFEMLGNWSFGDYYKKEACQMAWDLLLGPYRLKPDELVVTYFGGDAAIGLPEDRECRDVWRDIGVPESRLRALNAADNFWEMGPTGPCGPCTEIHHVNRDGTLTEIWNLVFIHCNREADGTVTGLRQQHVDTGMGLERMAALLQGVPSNYETDLFAPIIRAIEENSKGVAPYSGRYGEEAELDCAYRRLADHARMISVCLADGVFPSTSLNLKQIMRKTFKLTTDVFQNPQLLHKLYDEVCASLGPTYPELVSREREAKVVISHEAESYRKLRSDLKKKWKGLAERHPEVVVLSGVEVPGFAQGYGEFKEAMSKQNTTVIPGELVFKLYDTHGFQEDIIDQIAKLNNLSVDQKGFRNLLAKHKSRHKTAFKEQSSNKGMLFDNCIKELRKRGFSSTNDQPKYDYTVAQDKVAFQPLDTKLIAVLNEDIEWVDHLDPCENRSYYLVTEDTNFYCEEGGQMADSGVIRLKNDVVLIVDSVFKIRDFVFHKGCFELNTSSENNYVSYGSDAKLEIDGDKRFKLMQNHTAVHLLNAAVRRVLTNSVVCQTGSGVTDRGLYLNLSVYGERLSQKVMLEAEDLVRDSIKSNALIETRVLDGVQMANEADVVTVPGETYPETGLRLVTAHAPLISKELCCGTHVPRAGLMRALCVTAVGGAGTCAPALHALAGARADQARELFCRAQKLNQVIDLVDPERKTEEISLMKSQLAELCGGGGGAPYGEYAQCLALLDNMQKRAVNKNEIELQAVAEAEVREASAAAAAQGRRCVVHFVRGSYLLQGAGLPRVLRACLARAAPAPALLVGCAGGVIVAACSVPAKLVTPSFTAERWLGSVLPAFDARLEPPAAGQEPHTYAQMTATKVSLITCEQQVQDAMRAAVQYAHEHAKDARDCGAGPAQGRRRSS